LISFFVLFKIKTKRKKEEERKYIKKTYQKREKEELKTLVCYLKL